MLKRNAFTVVELMVVLAIILLLVAILVPSFVHARDHARYVRWAAHSHALSNSPSTSIHYDMEGQTGEERNKSDQPVLYNKAVGDPLRVATGANRETGHGQMGTGVANTAPLWSDFSRFDAKESIDFDGGFQQRVCINKTYGYRELPEMTAVCWVWSDNASDEQVMFSFDRSSVFRFALKDANGPKTVAFDSVTQPAVPVNTVDDMHTDDNYTDGKWHMLVASYNHAGSLDRNDDGTPERKRIYADGELVKWKGDPHNGLPLGQSDGAPNWGTEDGRNRTYGYLGVGSEQYVFCGAPGPTSWLDAYLDQVVLQEREMNPTEIRDMYKVGKPREKR